MPPRPVFLQQLTGWREPRYLRETIDTLEQLPVFDRIPRRHLKIIARALYPRRYAPGEPLYLEGDPGLGMYIIKQGKVRLSVGDEKGEEEIGCVEGPEIIGYASLFGDFRRMETAVALTDVEALGLFRPDLRDLLKYYPRAAALLVYNLGYLLAGLNVALIHQISTLHGKVEALQWAYTNLCRHFEPHGHEKG